MINNNHWRSHLDSTLLGAYSLYNDSTDKFDEVDVQIVRLTHENHNLGASGNRKCHVMYVSGFKKPMQLKSEISSAISEALGTPNTNKWVGCTITLYVKKVKFGREVVDAIRAKKSNAAQDYSAALARVNACKTLAELQTVFMSLTPNEKTYCNNAKDELKKKLS